MSTAQSDLVVRDRNGRLVALVEVKVGPQVTPELAAKVREYVLQEGQSVPFFLLVSQDRVFVWASGHHGGDAGEPQTCPIDEVIATYWPSRKLDHKPTADQLQFITKLWLMDLTKAFSDEVTDAPSRCLAKAGFLEAVHEGSVLNGVDA